MKATTCRFNDPEDEPLSRTFAGRELLLVIASMLLFLLSGCSASPVSGRLFSISYDHALPRSAIAIMIPGLGQSDSSPGYDSIGAFFRARGITPVCVNMNWKAAGVRRLGLAALQLDTVLHDSFPGAQVSLFGFSFGAVVALKVAQTVPASHILLCSMSPLYKEDREYQIFPLRQLMGLFIGKNDLSYSAGLGRCITFLYGDHDNFVINKAIIRHRHASFTCNETMVVKNAHHDISGPDYQAAIKTVIGRITK